MNSKELKLEIVRNDISIPKLAEKIETIKKLCIQRFLNIKVSTKDRYQLLLMCSS